MGFLDANALNVAIPAIQSNLEASALQTYWVVEIYILVLATTMVLGGALVDRFGVTKVVYCSITFFGISSAACMLANTIEFLLFTRLIQALSASAMLPVSLAMINISHSPEAKNAAYGTWAATLAVMVPLGPLIGGLLTDLISWRFIFAINLPFVALVLYLFDGKPFEGKNSHFEFDWIGNITFAGSIFCFTIYFLTEDKSPVAIYLSALIFLLFFFSQYISKNPVIPISYFSTKLSFLVSFQTFLFYGAYQSSVLYFCFILINVHQYDSFLVGLSLLPISIFVFLTSKYAGALLTHKGPRFVLGISYCLMSVSLFLLSLIDMQEILQVLGVTSIMGISVGLFSAPITSLAMATVASNRSGLASSVNNTISRLGPLIFIAVLGSMANDIFIKTASEEISLMNLFSDTAGNIDSALSKWPEINWPLSKTDSNIINKKLSVLYSDAYSNVFQTGFVLSLIAAFSSIFYNSNTLRFDSKR